MTDTMIFLAAALIGAGVYIMHLHNIIGKYRRWSAEAQTLLLSLSMKAAMDEYGFDAEPRRDDEGA